MSVSESVVLEAIVPEGVFFVRSCGPKNEDICLRRVPELFRWRDISCRASRSPVKLPMPSPFPVEAGEDDATAVAGT